MNTFLQQNHIIILAITSVTFLISLMPPYNYPVHSQHHFISEKEDSNKESQKKDIKKSQIKFQTDEEEDDEDLSNDQEEHKVQVQNNDEVFFHLYDNLRK